MRLSSGMEILPGPMANTPPTYRPILMSARNRQLTSANWEYGKPQLYGRAVESVQDSARESLHSDSAHLSQPAREKQVILRLRSLSEKLHFNQDGIKRGRVAQVGEFFRREYVDILAPGCKFCPVQLGRDHSRRNTAVDLGLQLDLAAAIEDSNFISVAKATRLRVR